MLEAKEICAGYGDLLVLFGVSMKVKRGEIVTLIGSNGAGKSSFINVITGLLKPTFGSVKFLDTRIDSLLGHQIVKLGISHIPEGRHIFYNMTVLENLKMGSYTRGDKLEREKSFDQVFQLFPRLKERKNQLGGTLSGGEQQMLAIGRGLMSKPILLILDEPSLGLAPRLVKTILETAEEINRQGTTILLVEQNVRESLRLSKRAYVLQTGRVVLEGEGSELLESSLIKKAYLGL